MNVVIPIAPTGAMRLGVVAGSRALPGRGWKRGLLAGLFITVIRTACAQTGWQSSDIGTSTAGATSEAGGVIAITGSGRDIWNEADGFRFYYREVPGEFDFAVHVRSLQNTNGWAKAALMARRTLEPGSQHSTICVSAEHGTALQWREFANEASASTTPTEDGGAPRWLRLTRTVGGGFGEPYRISGYTSLDGINWTLQSSNYTAYTGPLLVGLAVTSHVEGVRCTAEFDQFVPRLPPTVASNLRVTHLGPDGQIDLAWNDNSADETGFVIEARRERLQDYEKIGEVGANVTTFSARGGYLAEGWGYNLRVKAMNGAAGAYSDVGQALTTPNVTLSVLSQASTAIGLRIVETAHFMSTSDGWYAIERSTDNASFVQIAGGLRSTSATVSSKTCDYTDQTVTPSATYYYRARYLNPNGDAGAYGTLAGPVTASDGPTSPPPSGTWQSQDIGEVARSGFTSESNGVVSVEGSGADIWNQADEFRYRYQAWTGDGVITARAIYLANTNGWAKAAVMFRETLAANSRHATMLVSAAHGTAFQYRTATGAEMGSNPPSESGGTPRWLRLTRVGNTVTGHTSTDGVTWTQSGTITLSGLPVSIYVGLAVTSHDDGTLCSAQFDNVSVTTSVTPPPTDPVAAPSNARVIRLGPNGSVEFGWNDNSTNETGFVIEAWRDFTGNPDNTWVQQATTGPNETRVTVTLGMGTQCKLRVKAVNGSISSSYAGVDSFITTVTPTLRITGTTPTAVSLEIEARLNQSSLPRINGPFAVERSTDGVTFTQIASVGDGSYSNTATGGLGYTDTTVAAGARYYYRARYLDSAGNTSAYSNIADSGLSPPLAPSDLTPKVLSATEIALRWLDNANNETGYEIHRAVGAGSLVYYTMVGAGFSGYTDAGLTPGETYQYKVRAINAAGASGFSNTASVTITTANTPPAVPTNLHVVHRGEGSIDLAWTDNSTDETGFVIEMRPGVRDASFGVKGTVGPNVTTFSVTGLGEGGAFDFQVKAVKGGISSNYYSFILGIITTVTPHPIVLGTTANSVTLHWADTMHLGYISPSTGPFSVERSTDGSAYTEIARGVTGVLLSGGYDSRTDYTDTTVAPATTYYYRVRYYDPANGDTSGYGTCGPATTGNSTPPGSNWQSRDIGTTTAGSTSASADGRAVTLAGSGRDIWNEADGFRFYSQATSASDSDLIVRVASLTTTNGWAKAGLMYRQSLDPGSPFLAIIVSAEHGTAFQWRSDPGGFAQSTAPSEDGPAPRWLKLSRRGSIFSGSTSRDGVNWTLVTSMSISRIGSTTALYAGLVVTSHNDGVLCTAQFDNVAFTAGSAPPPPPGTVPPAPGNLVASAASSSQINLSWVDNSTDETGFEVARSTDNVSYTRIATTNANVTSYSDSGLAAGTTYYYYVRAVNATGPSAASNTASATTTTATAPTWAFRDIGAVGVTGWNNSLGNVIAISGSGSDIWDRADAFRFVYRAWTGDGVVEARVSSMEATNPYAKAGVMIRETLEANAKNVFLCVTPYDHPGVLMQARSVTGDLTGQWQGPFATAPHWVRLVRSGDTFRRYTSADGINWVDQGSFVVAMGSTVYFGFAVTSHDNTRLNTAMFSDGFVGSR